MIHLVAIQTSPGEWKIVTTETQHIYLATPHCHCTLCVRKRREHERPDKLIQKMRESGREWVEDIKKESGREEV